MHIKTAPMGWNSWNTFMSEINEKLILESADAMVEKGYRDAGYEYIVIDDCWSMKERDENGRLVPNPEKFPHGMKYVADYIHSKGLKFGMYSCAGILTCAGYPSSYGHEFIDAATFAEWGVDFLKYDFCYFPKNADGKQAYLTMSNALRTCGRDILFSACNWGCGESWNWMASVGAHMYRSTGDIYNAFESMKKIALSQIPHFNCSGPGCFNDIDMLTVGMYDKGALHRGDSPVQTDADYKTQFALWCMLSAPLMMGGDIRNTNDFCHELLTNRELISINQDPDARQPYDFSDLVDSRALCLFKVLSNNEFALGLFNLADKEATAKFFPTCVGFPNYSGAKLLMKDVFTGEEVTVKDYFMKTLPSHDCVVYKVKAVF